MTDFEYLESQGQMNIFDFLEITPICMRNKTFEECDRVTVRFYVDELEYIRTSLPHLEMGIRKFPTGETVDIFGEKLKLA